MVGQSPEVCAKTAAGASATEPRGDVAEVTAKYASAGTSDVIASAAIGLEKALGVDRANPAAARRRARSTDRRSHDGARRLDWRARARRSDCGVPLRSCQLGSLAGEVTGADDSSARIYR
jgi:hypothetical protein